MKHKQMIRFMPKGVLSKKKKKCPKGEKISAETKQCPTKNSEEPTLYQNTS